MRGIDFTSLNSIITGLIGLALVTLIGMGVRLVMMMTIQQRRERLNRQINERLRTLIAAYKALGGSFTGDLTVPMMATDEQRDAIMASWRLLRDHGARRVYPGHGPVFNFLHLQLD